METILPSTVKCLGDILIVVLRFLNSQPSFFRVQPFTGFSPLLLIILAQVGSLCYYGNVSARRLLVPLEDHQMATGASPAG